MRRHTRKRFAFAVPLFTLMSAPIGVAAGQHDTLTGLGVGLGFFLGLVVTAALFFTGADALSAWADRGEP